LYRRDILTSNIKGRPQIKGVSAKGAEQNFKNHNGKGCLACGWNLNVSEQVSVAESCKHSNELPDSMQGRKYLNQNSDC
jgi:hypothetical protein